MEEMSPRTKSGPERNRSTTTKGARHPRSPRGPGFSRCPQKPKSNLSGAGHVWCPSNPEPVLGVHGRSCSPTPGVHRKLCVPLEHAQAPLWLNSVPGHGHRNWSLRKKGTDRAQALKSGVDSS